jgi:hypothetical protein
MGCRVATESSTPETLMVPHKKMAEHTGSGIEERGGKAKDTNLRMELQ